MAIILGSTALTSRSADAARLECGDLHNYVYFFVTLLLIQAALAWPLLAHLRRRNQSKATELGADLTHHARLALAGELTASIAHEISQPLSAILNNVETAELLLTRNAVAPDTIMPILVDIKRDNLRAYEVVKRLRALLRKQEVRLEPVDVNALVGTAVQLVRADAERRQIRLHPELEPGLPAIHADAIHMQQVVLNLLVNAMESMQETPSASRRVLVRTRLRAGAAVEVSIRDNGAGIEPSQVNQIFEPFFSTKENGMGLGLSIARSIVQAHGGTIRVEPASDTGSTFTVRLPLPQRSSIEQD